MTDGSGGPALPGGAATAMGSWPGVDGLEAARIIAGELPVLPHLAELPARGAGADPVGRTAAMLVDIPVDASWTGYRLAYRPGAVLRRARAHLARDMDFAEQARAEAGPQAADAAMKLQILGPVTMAARVETRSGRRALTDRGAARDLADSLAEGVRGRITEARRRFGVRPILQIDEPDLTAALAGALPGPTRFDPVRAVPSVEAEALLRGIVEGAGAAPVLLDGVGPHAPAGMARAIGAAAVTLPLHGTDVDRDLDAAVLDGIGEWLDSGRTVVFGLVPSVRPGGCGPDPGWDTLARPALDVIDRLGFPRAVLARQSIVAPEAGLAAAAPEWARAALTLTNRIAAGFSEAPEEL